MNIPEANLRNMLSAISAGNHVLNEQIKLVKQTEVDCPDCGYDPIRKESINFNCESCSGTGSYITITSQTIPASIETEEDFKYEFTKAGRITKGQILLTIDTKEIKEKLNSDGKFNLDEYVELKAFIDQYSYIMWKGARYIVESFEAGWLQGNLYEISMTLNLSEQ